MSDIPTWMVRGQTVAFGDSSFEYYMGVILGVVRKLNSELWVVVEVIDVFGKNESKLITLRPEQLTPKGN